MCRSYTCSNHGVSEEQAGLTRDGADVHVPADPEDLVLDHPRVIRVPEGRSQALPGRCPEVVGHHASEAPMPGAVFGWLQQLLHDGTAQECDPDQGRESIQTFDMHLASNSLVI